jgi:oligopeptidase B
MKNRTVDFRLILLLQLLMILPGCNRTGPPVALEIASEKVIHGIRINDPYKWMENIRDPKTLAYINAENIYAGRYFSHISALTGKIRKEIDSREEYAKQQNTFPVLKGDYFYYTRIPEGKNLPVHYRRMNKDQSKEEIVLDENLLAAGSENFRMNQFLVSPDFSRFLYRYTLNGNKDILKIASFNTNLVIDSLVAPLTCVTWAVSGTSIVYVNNKREVYSHLVKSPLTDDRIIYTENRSDLFVDIDLSVSGNFIFITSYNNESTECRYFPSDLKFQKPILIEPLRKGHRYFTEHFGADFFIILSNMDAPNRKLFKTNISLPSSKNWITVLEGSDSIYIDSYDILDQKYLVLAEKKMLTAGLRIIDLTYKGKDNHITFKEPDGQIDLSYYDKQDDKIIFTLSSMLTPSTAYSYDINSRKLTLHGRPPIKDYRKDDYIAQLLWAKGKDGTSIPVSVIHKNGMKRSDGTNPLWLFTYGNYGTIFPDVFNPVMISLLDRGFFIAYAHVRGGGESGSDWWNSGRLMKKKNAISDYIACSEFLIKSGCTSKGMITAVSDNAGGLVIGAVLNERPDLYKCAVLSMPFVDPLPSLSDSSENHDTPNEWLEFGNPNIREQFEYLYSYSPYNNIKKQNYPAMLFRTFLKDQDAGYSGPLKMVACLRNYKTDKNILLIKIDSIITHQGDTGEKSADLISVENLAFILDQYGINE